MNILISGRKNDYSRVVKESMGLSKVCFMGDRIVVLMMGNKVLRMGNKVL